MRQTYYRICLFLGIYKREDFVTAYDIVNYALKNYPETGVAGICRMLQNALYDLAGIKIHWSRVPKYLKKFNKHFLGAPESDNGLFWWPQLAGDKALARYVRIRALGVLKAYYFKHNILIKKMS